MPHVGRYRRISTGMCSSEPFLNHSTVTEHGCYTAVNMLRCMAACVSSSAIVSTSPAGNCAPALPEETSRKTQQHNVTISNIARQS